jgi:NNP family nitrate/nitrite transporter-like MFS transporter
VAGIVGAGGNAGAVAAGFLFRMEGFSTELALLYLGIGVTLVAPLALLVRFSAQTEAQEKEAMPSALGGLAQRGVAEMPEGVAAPSAAD